MTNSDQIIIIKKKKGGHGGHHGGAWKVAYADFVTAMMALFIVLWLLNTSKPTQEAIGGYFRDPKGTAEKKGTDRPDAGNAGAAKKDDMSKLEEKLMKSLRSVAGFEKLKDQIEMKLTDEGLKIELMETPKGTFFENGKAIPTDTLTQLLGVMAVEIAKLPNPIMIEGHTDGTPYAAGTYGNWELSADRANMARRLMEAHGVREDQVVEVRGYADRNLRKPNEPQDASNRRVTVLVRYAPHAGPEPSVTYAGGNIAAADLTPPKEPQAKKEGEGKKDAESKKEAKPAKE